MKNYEKKSFLTTLFLFFIPLFIFSSVVLFMYFQDKVKDMQQGILYQMKDYTYDFQSNKFSLDIIEKKEEKKLFKIYFCKEGLCAYFEMPSSKLYFLKVVFDKDKYENIYQQLVKRVLKFSIIIFFSLLILSSAFALYSLKPMREALSLLENFLKDIIHDLNTPATSILLNSKLLKRRGDFEEIERIELSAKTISSLYKNLEFMNPNKIQRDESINLIEVITQKIEIFKKIYPNIKFNVNLENKIIHSNKNGIDRILDNLLTNACKYNKKNGQIDINLQNKKMIISDTGIGIKDVKRVFQRYYKENERGLGIGMNIVKQLCDILHISIKVKSEIGKGTQVLLEFP